MILFEICLSGSGHFRALCFNQCFAMGWVMIYILYTFLPSNFETISIHFEIILNHFEIILNPLTVAKMLKNDVNCTSPTICGGIAEGWISQASVDKPAQDLSDHNRVVAEIARAKQSMQLSAARQSRFMLWASFSEEAANLARKAVSEKKTDAEALQAITSFRPSTLNAENQRQYQIVALTSIDIDI